MAKVSTGIDVTAKDIRMVCLTPKKGGQLHLTDHAIVPLSDREAVRNFMSSASIRAGITRFSIHE
jgi:hypothetical protein